MCHHCGHSARVDERCPVCGGTLRYIGTGTQKVVEELRELFPDTEVLRMDTDSVAPAGSHEALLSRFRDEGIPILVGTQMVTKGLNFENVTLVGVLSADQSLYAGDYPLRRAHLFPHHPGGGPLRPVREAGTGRHPDHDPRESDHPAGCPAGL
jgi:primosomal protein N'